MISLTVNGITYQYPEVDDDDWGNQATLWASSVSDVLLCMRKPTLPNATEGVVRLGNNDHFSWRNFGDTANADLYLGVDDKLYIKVGSDPAIDLTANASGNVTGPVSSTDNALARYDGASGQVIQDSSALLSDGGALTGLASLDSVVVKENGVDVTDLFIHAVTTPTDNAIARWDGTGGKLVQNSLVTIGDTGNVAGIVDLAISGNQTITGTLGVTGLTTVVDIAVGGILTVAGATVLNGNVTLGDSSGDVITAKSSILADANTLDLGSAAKPFGKAYLHNNIASSSTPDANALYANLMPKAWATTSTTAILSGVNLSLSHSGTGTYVYTFKRAMADANYCVQVTFWNTGGFGGSPIRYFSVINKSTTSFEVFSYDANTGSGSQTATDSSHSVMVIGAQ